MKISRNTNIRKRPQELHHIELSESAYKNVFFKEERNKILSKKSRGKSEK